MIRCPNTLRALEAGSVLFQRGPFRPHRLGAGRQGSPSGVVGDPGTEIAVYGPSQALSEGTAAEDLSEALAHGE